MLTAKLFAGSACVLTLLAVIATQMPGFSTELYIFDWYFVFPGRSGIMLMGALICTVLAFVCFAVARWTRRPLSQPLTLVSFALISLSFIVWLASSFLISENTLHNHPHVAAQWGSILGSIFCILAGIALFAGSLLWRLFWALIGMARSRPSSF